MEGLTTNEADKKLRSEGRNIISYDEEFSVVGLFLSQFPTLINGILFAAAIFSFFIHNIIDGIFILIVLIANGLFSFIQEYKAEKALKALKDLAQASCRVIRDKKLQEIPIDNVVVDDLIFLEDGDRIPADGVIVGVTHVDIDESLLTGESVPINKTHDDELFRGTFVARGKVHMRVTKIGNATRFGKIAKSLADIHYEATPLQRQITQTTKVLSLAAAFLAVMLIPIGLTHNESLLPLLLITISIAVAAIPESLPGIVTVSLAIGAFKMAKKKAIIRKMSAIETLGAMQVVLLDKTGTLTQNSMRVKEVYMPDNKKQSFFLKACLLGNTASIDYEEHKQVIVGDKTDGALLLWAKQHTLDIDSIMQSGKVIDEFTFDPVSKTITTLWHERGKNYVFVRGAPEEVIERSTLSKEEKDTAIKNFKDYAQLGFRVIAFGYRIEPNHDGKSRKSLENHLEFLGLAGLFDPPRDEAKRAVEQAKKAGLKLVMVTGDNELTAVSIAKAVGLVGDNAKVVTGKELQELSTAKLETLVPEVSIFARTRPEDKLRLTQIYKKLGYLVGVTGDGVNDALALKQADVGVAMGEKGTDVAKEASDMILTNDNFATLIHAIAEGRIVYENLKRALTYLLSGNLSELLLIGIATTLGAPTPLLPTDILWMNLVTDVFPALSLAADSGHDGILQKHPRSTSEPLINRQRWFLIGLIGVGLATGAFILYAFLLGVMPLRRARTITFGLFIFSHMMLSFFVRGKQALTPNKFLFLSVALTLLAQIAISTIPFFQNIFQLGW
ncbi:MAG TPA: cation-transporting P-type ATPase [Patescibacteria group bacterium]